MLTGCVVEEANRQAEGPDGRVPDPKGATEQKYRATGPWGAVSTQVSDGVCDRENNRCDIWYPSALGQNPLTGARSGFKHPVVVWANGSGQPPSKYAFYLQHLASWGFIVVASRDKATATGDTTIDAANYILKRGSTSGDLFYGMVDRDQVGASGHSQGGSTLLKLASEDAAPFKAFVTIHSVPGLFGRICCGFDLESLSTMPSTKAILYLGGTGDKGNDRENRDAYQRTSESATKAIGLLEGSMHDDILGQPDCIARTPCRFGAYSYSGYATAWFMWQLQGATDVRSAFTSSGEFLSPHQDWNTNLSNVR